MNLPLGAIVVAGLIFFFRSPQASAKLANLPPKEKVKRMDPAGTVALVSAVTCLLLALQWGGQTYSWSDGRIIALLVLFGVTFIAWISWQVYLGPIATVPKHVIGQRSMAFASFYSFMQGGVNFGILYYAPLWFQAVKGHDAVRSGLDIVTFIAGMTVTMLAIGYVLTKGGYSAPFMILCVVMVSTACGLLTTWTPDSGDDKIYGYLTLYGLGQGFGWQQSMLIAQTMLPAADIPTGTSLTTVCKLLGGSIFVSVAQTLFNNKLHDMIIQRLPQLDPHVLMTIGAIELRSKLGADLIPTVAACYNDALKDVWWLLLALSGVSLVGAMGVEWRSVTDKVATAGGGPAGLAHAAPRSLLSLSSSVPSSMPSSELSVFKPSSFAASNQTETTLLGDLEVAREGKK